VIRLRPIVMTTAAMIFGMLPVALALSEGGETRAPMAVCVMGGLATSTLLTLVVVPVVYTFMDGLTHMGPIRWLARRLLTTEDHGSSANENGGATDAISLAVIGASPPAGPPPAGLGPQGDARASDA
jgi:hypothetical protein